MLKMIGILLFQISPIAIFGFTLAFGQDPTQYTNGSCWNYQNVSDWPGRNLSKYYCIVACLPKDSVEKAAVENSIEGAIYLKFPEYRAKMQDKHFKPSYAYTIEGHENLVLFGVASPVDIHDLFHPVLNKSQNRFYLVPKITTSELDTLLSTEKFYFHDDSYILNYCVLVSCLMNPCCQLELISNKTDIIMLHTIYGHAKLQNLPEYDSINIDIPKILTNENEINATYYMAISDYIEKVEVKIQQSHLIDYKETEVGHINDLFGPHSF